MENFWCLRENAKCAPRVLARPSRGWFPLSLPREITLTLHPNWLCNHLCCRCHSLLWSVFTPVPTIVLFNTGISRNSLYRWVVYHCNDDYVVLASQQNEVSTFLRDTLQSIKLSDRGVYVQASTLGSLEALLEFLRTEKIPVSTIFFASHSFILPLVYLVELINFPERRPWNEKLMNFNAFTQSHISLKS